MSFRRRLRNCAITSLDLHPNLAEILGIVRRVPQLTDREIDQLAEGWQETGYVSLARDHALAPDAPLVVEVLSAFDHVETLFREELSGSLAHDPDQDGVELTYTPHVINTALKAVRDALAAAYARPVLPRAEYATLIAPWRRVFGTGPAISQS